MSQSNCSGEPAAAGGEGRTRERQWESIGLRAGGNKRRGESAKGEPGTTATAARPRAAGGQPTAAVRGGRPREVPPPTGARGRRDLKPNDKMTSPAGDVNEGVASAAGILPILSVRYQ